MKDMSREKPAQIVARLANKGGKLNNSYYRRLASFLAGFVACTYHCFLAGNIAT
jgi:hypothetical protein